LGFILTTNRAELSHEPYTVLKDDGLHPKRMVSHYRMDWLIWTSTPSSKTKPDAYKTYEAFVDSAH